jgi:hypothetical protein
VDQHRFLILTAAPQLAAETPWERQHAELLDVGCGFKYHQPPATNSTAPSPHTIHAVTVCLCGVVLISDRFPFGNPSGFGGGKLHAIPGKAPDVMANRLVSLNVQSSV